VVNKSFPLSLASEAGAIMANEILQNGGSSLMNKIKASLNTNNTQ
jgi:hypothetical protein